MNAGSNNVKTRILVLRIRKIALIIAACALSILGPEVSGKAVAVAVGVVALVALAAVVVVVAPEAGLVGGLVARSSWIGAQSNERRQQQCEN